MYKNAIFWGESKEEKRLSSSYRYMLRSIESPSISSGNASLLYKLIFFGSKARTGQFLFQFSTF